MGLIFSDFQPIAAIATTPTSALRLQSLCQTSGATLWVPESIASVTAARVYTGSLKAHLATLWPHHRSFIFSLATGAVVRLIAPLLQHKSSDPAVVVVDEAGQFVISLCSGHQGGADQLTALIALQLGATPVVTSASASLGPAVDLLGIPFGWKRGAGDWTAVSAAVAKREPVQVIQEAGSTLWQHHLPDGHPFYFELSEGKGGVTQPSSVSEESQTPKARIWISPLEQLPLSDSGVRRDESRLYKNSGLPEVLWHPRVLWVGIGCERGTSRTLIEMAIRAACQSSNLSEYAIAGVATIDLKADEVGLVDLCRDRLWPLRTFPASVLRSVQVPNPSNVVATEVGTPSVAEAAAIMCAIAPLSQIPNPLLVPKQIYRSSGEPGAVTVAIAQSSQEYTGRQGKLLLVGTGPGKLDQMTPAAQMAIAGADAAIGYSLYIELIAPLLRPGQIVEALPITQERQRAKRAIELALWGLTVAVVSSGDSGIYGMAGLVLEELRAQGWDGKTPAVQVFPGITALQAAASRVGAPLMHDFCAISLSDLLTPKEVIEKRLTAAAQADFVTALYNPRSRTRTELIAIAQQIFLKYRDRNTPVALVRSAYREDEQITLTTLDKFVDIPIDMLTTVLIGNQSSVIHADWMITPRGYLGFDTK